MIDKLDESRKETDQRRRMTEWYGTKTMEKDG